jgi:hypothetical protein
MLHNAGKLRHLVETMTGALRQRSFACASLWLVFQGSCEPGQHVQSAIVVTPPT